ncbi:MAG: hypothetical protein J7L82_03235 [Staphylothermus sp.]|nr:hypothetical protein [Staphylothermus sp.]
MTYVTVSAKIPKKLKDLMDKYGIKPGPIIRRALEEEVKKRMLEEAEVRLKQILEDLDTSFISDDEELLPVIREEWKRK